MTDPPNEPHDVIEYPGSYISRLIESCEIYKFHPLVPWARTNAIDGIIHCMEQQVDPAAANTFFSFRNPQLTAFRETATEPGGSTQRQDVRRLWLWNLYRQ